MSGGMNAKRVSAARGSAQRTRRHRGWRPRSPCGSGFARSASVTPSARYVLSPSSCSTKRCSAAKYSRMRCPGVSGLNLTKKLSVMRYSLSGMPVAVHVVDDLSSARSRLHGGRRGRRRPPHGPVPALRSRPRATRPRPEPRRFALAFRYRRGSLPPHCPAGSRSYVRLARRYLVSDIVDLLSLMPGSWAQKKGGYNNTQIGYRQPNFCLQIYPEIPAKMPGNPWGLYRAWRCGRIGSLKPFVRCPSGPPYPRSWRAATHAAAVSPARPAARHSTVWTGTAVWGRVAPLWFLGRRGGVGSWGMGHSSWPISRRLRFCPPSTILFLSIIDYAERKTARHAQLKSSQAWPA